MSVALDLVQAGFAQAWPALAFRPGRLDLAVTWIAVATALTAATALFAARVDRQAGLLIAPTVAWLLFATALVRELERLNPLA